MKSWQNEYQLTDVNIDVISERITEYLKSKNINKQTIIKTRLNIEQILLTWQEKFSKDASVILSAENGFGQYKIQVHIAGPECNPLLGGEDELGQWTKSMLSKLEVTPEFTYKKDTNAVIFAVPKPKKNPIFVLFVALVLAIFAGLAGSYMPEAVRTEIVENWLAPIYNTYLNVLGLCGIPLIFLSVVLGIVGIGDLQTFTRIGTKMIRRFFKVLALVVILAIVCTLPFFSFSMSTGSVGFSYRDLLDMALGWLPTGLFQPFIDSNAMQLILLGAIFGIAMLIRDTKTRTLYKALDDLNTIMLDVAVWFTRLIPIFVFIAVVKTFWLSQLDVIIPVWKSWVLTTLLEALIVFGMIVYICLKYKVAFAKLVKKISHTFFIAFGTNSCTATVPEEYACCAGKLGIDSKVFTFGIPLGTSVFKPATAVRLVVLGLYMASANDVGISFVWLCMLLVMAFILSIAIPAIPGGVLMLSPMLFSQLGIPAEVMAQMLATDIFFDAICTAANQVAVELALIQHAGSIDLLDKDMLRA